MKNKKEDFDRKIAGILSEYVDQLNKGIAPSTEEFLKRHDKAIGEHLKPMLKAAGFVKDETRARLVSNSIKTQVFERVKAALPPNRRLAALFPLRWRLTPVTVGLFSIIVVLPLLTGIFLGNVYLKQVVSPGTSSLKQITTAFYREVYGSFGKFYNKVIGG